MRRRRSCRHSDEWRVRGGRVVCAACGTDVTDALPGSLQQAAAAYLEVPGRRSEPADPSTRSPGSGGRPGQPDVGGGEDGERTA